jgi:hypothetical protein
MMITMLNMQPRQRSTTQAKKIATMNAKTAASLAIIAIVMKLLPPSTAGIRSLAWAGGILHEIPPQIQAVGRQPIVSKTQAAGSIASCYRHSHYTNYGFGNYFCTEGCTMTDLQKKQARSSYFYCLYIASKKFGQRLEKDDLHNDEHRLMNNLVRNEYVIQKNTMLKFMRFYITDKGRKLLSSCANLKISDCVSLVHSVIASDPSYNMSVVKDIKQGSANFISVVAHTKNTGIAKSTLRKHVTLGELFAIKIGKSYRIWLGVNECGEPDLPMGSPLPMTLVKSIEALPNPLSRSNIATFLDIDEYVQKNQFHNLIIYRNEFMKYILDRAAER